MTDDGLHRKMSLKRMAGIGGWYTILKGREEKEGHLQEYKWVLKYLNKEGGGGERALMGKQMTFEKHKWAFRRIDGQQDSLRDVCLDLLWRLLLHEG